MSVAEFKIHIETEAERIARWRAEELERAGYDPVDAASSRVGHVDLHSRSSVDLHRAVDLLAPGCPRASRMRILL